MCVWGGERKTFRVRDVSTCSECHSLIGSISHIPLCVHELEVSVHTNSLPQFSSFLEFFHSFNSFTLAKHNERTQSTVVSSTTPRLSTPTLDHASRLSLAVCPSSTLRRRREEAALSVSARRCRDEVVAWTTARDVGDGEEGEEGEEEI